MTEIAAITEKEREILHEIRQAKTQRRPQTFIIRVVDGIIQLMIAEPFPPQPLDKRKTSR